MAVGKFRDQLTALAFAAIDPTNDQIGMFDDSINEEVKVQAIEFLKRMISTGDVSWMTTIALTGVEFANDKILIWDNSLTKFTVMPASDLLNRTFAGASIAGFTGIPSFTVTDPSNDWIPIWDSATSTWKIFRVGLMTTRLLQLASIAVTTTPRAINGTTENAYRFNNYGATQIIVFQLPVGVIYSRFVFEHIAAYDVEIDPNGSEAFVGGGAGKKLIISQDGAVEIEWRTGVNKWFVVGGSALYDFEL